MGLSAFKPFSYAINPKVELGGHPLSGEYPACVELTVEDPSQV